jgi:hypothetical protein
MSASGSALMGAAARLNWKVRAHILVIMLAWEWNVLQLSIGVSVFAYCLIISTSSCNEAVGF